MTKLIAYKTANNTISICSPAAKADVQRDLNKMSKADWVAQHHASGQYEVNRGMSRAHHDRRIAWAANVNDFSNLTDAEFQSLIECDVEEGHQYKHWIESLPQQDVHRDAWTDIDASGNVTYDPVKAKDITMQKLAANITAKREALQKADDMVAVTPEHTKALSDAKDLLAKAKALDVSSHQDVIDKLKPLHKDL